MVARARNYCGDRHPSCDSLDVRKILIVDDEPHILTMLRFTFERAGYDVALASNVEEAMAALRSRGFDVVLSDVIMPGASGYELAEWIAVNHSGTPTLLMSGGQSFRNGAEGCYHTLVRKPFRPCALVAAVEDALRS